MTHHEFDRDNAMIDSVVKSLQDQPIPLFANPKFEFPESNHNSQAKEPNSGNQARTTHFFRAKPLLAAAVCFAILAPGLLLLPWDGNSQLALAQMQQAIRDTRTASFEIKTFTDDDLTGKYEITLLQPGDVRMKSADETHVLNASTAEYMTIDDTNQTVRIEPIYDLTKTQRQLTGAFDALLNLNPLPTTTTRTINFNGKPARELKIVWDQSVATAIVDIRTNLPIEIRLDGGTDPDGKPVREVVSNFQFSNDTDFSISNIVPPVGYDVTRIERRDPIASSVDLTLTAGKGLGPVHFGMSLQEVKEHLGDPDTLASTPLMVAKLDKNDQLVFPMQMVPANPPQQMTIMQYRSLGIQIEVSSVDGVQWIRCYEKRMKWAQFEGATSAGIKIGMPKTQVKTLLPPEALARASWNQNDNRWLSNGLDLVFSEDTLVGMSAGASSFIEK